MLHAITLRYNAFHRALTCFYGTLWLTGSSLFNFPSLFFTDILYFFLCFFVDTQSLHVYTIPHRKRVLIIKEIVYFSKKITTDEALDLGLVNEVVPHDSLLKHAREAALKLIPPKRAGLAIRKTKRAFHKHLKFNKCPCF